MLSIRNNAERLRETMGCLGNSGILAEVFIGLDASVTGIDSTKWPYEIDHPGSNYKISNKNINMVLSYLMLWKTLQAFREDAFVIVEDDVRFDADWKIHFYEGLTHLPEDWDLLYLGSCCCENRACNKLIWGRLYKISYALCTHAFAVRAKALPILLDRCEKIWATIDIAIALQCMPQLNCYAFLPRLATQFQTDISP